ncbi:hypothetical protein TWF225_009374 [Orbilia oligospora]|uniref:Uncharacterized protein n=1 Tax=Orbilia oligospora TaxID=2813651 RepID=A0A7C8U2P7_ORBOL|nr:hypothetical protein TWF751_001947 [Orbilia oligospora]KAF3193831.1 hypothetical protein TWF225_009374 [Orbilia oligospora]KAF3270016.1 hypothetical protein TWF217_008359 [Orbilia oligospora]KAF3270482.1 hypothetical protein TWF128_004249 [Orbilia oligospora]KAF3298033.1 hypothetical protein TWF132_004175 [Orbilia oligospora]
MASQAVQPQTDSAFQATPQTVLAVQDLARGPTSLDNLACSSGLRKHRLHSRHFRKMGRSPKWYSGNSKSARKATNFVITFSSNWQTSDGSILLFLQRLSKEKLSKREIQSIYTVFSVETPDSQTWDMPVRYRSGPVSFMPRLNT